MADCCAWISSIAVISIPSFQVCRRSQRSMAWQSPPWRGTTSLWPAWLRAASPPLTCAGSGMRRRSKVRTFASAPHPGERYTMQCQGQQLQDGSYCGLRHRRSTTGAVIFITIENRPVCFMPLSRLIHVIEAKGSFFCSYWKLLLQ